MSLLLLSSLNNVKNPFEFESQIKKVDRIFVQSDLSNIQVISNHSDLFIEYQGEKTTFGEPKIDISYIHDKAIISVFTNGIGWKKFLPIKTQRGNLVLNIPPQLVEELHLETKNGNIDIGQITGINQLSLISNVGTIRLDNFQGELLNVKSGNGSIYLGEVDGRINIRNKVGSLKSLTLKSIKEENTIDVSNGNVKVKLPNGMEEVGLNISTKNGTIKYNDSKWPIIKKGAGKELINELNNSDGKLNISVSVGTIEIN